ncbi:hypothetical protein [Pseudoalteromonas luteoviolacea]|nr:hypothetical protein [Pseudoalteromonas luteoviolacea]
MPVVKFKFNYGHTYLTSGGLAAKTSCITGDSVACTMADGTSQSLKFRGFTSIFRTRQFECVTVHNIIGIKNGTALFGGGDWVDVQGDFMGVYIDGYVYLVLGDRGLPVVDEKYEKPKEKPPGQVVSMEEFRGKLRNITHK